MASPRLPLFRRVHLHLSHRPALLPTQAPPQALRHAQSTALAFVSPASSFMSLLPVERHLHRQHQLHTQQRPPCRTFTTPVVATAVKRPQAPRKPRPSSSSSSSSTQKYTPSSNEARHLSTRPQEQQEQQQQRDSSNNNDIKISTVATTAVNNDDSDNDFRHARRARPASGALSNVGVSKPLINWYPGHIAKAERALKDTIKMVDVVIEVRDARIPVSTAHPSVAAWLGSRSRVVVLNRADLAPERARSLWKRYYDTQSSSSSSTTTTTTSNNNNTSTTTNSNNTNISQQQQQDHSRVRFVNAKQGRGVREVHRAAVQLGQAMNERRKRKGLLPRRVRCLVMGFPNVGKSALINKLVGRNCVKSANKPGVTRNFQWIRISDDLELLDMPGIIPAKLVTQQQAVRLAICDDIGHAAYDAQIIAAALVDELKHVVQCHGDDFFNFDILAKRFGRHPIVDGLSGEDFLHEAAAKIASNDLERTAVRLLTEFRAGTLGPVALEAPPTLQEEVREQEQK